MRNIKLLAVLGLIAAIAAGQPTLAQSNSSSQSSSSSTSSSASSSAVNSSSSSTTSATPQDALASAARKAKEQKKEAPKTAKVFTNDNMPTEGTISSVGKGVTNSTSTASTTSSDSADKGESYWRDKFSKLQAKLSQDQSELAVSQRELGVLSLQNYSDPNQAMQQGYSRSDIDKKNAEIETKKKDIAADQQAIDDAQTDMLKAGGQPGWAR
jgi:hypothetical protein